MKTMTRAERSDAGWRELVECWIAEVSDRVELVMSVGLGGRTVMVMKDREVVGSVNRQEPSENW